MPLDIQNLREYLIIILIAFVIYIWRGTRWGSTKQERLAPMEGDSYPEGGAMAKARFTRAISIAKSPEIVWPWIAQMGRGAGWYSIDRLDNGGKPSASHIITWIPKPARGDASAIGYLRHIEPEKEMAWWIKGDRFMGATTRMVTSIRITPDGSGSRLVIRISGDMSGLTAWPVLWLFKVVDSIMAKKQLRGIKKRAERYGDRVSEPDRPESGNRDQYQLYNAVYADGAQAGVKGKEKAPLWRQAAIDDGILAAEAAS